MEFIIIIIVSTVLTMVLRYAFEYNMKKIKNIADNKELDGIVKKYPSNLSICKYYLNKLNNENVKIEEEKNATASLYIAITNKIVIANITDTYTRIQTIAHECLHSIQSRRLLIFNFIFSNIYLLYFVIICILAFLNILPLKMMFLTIFVVLSMGYCTVRVFLENDAMIKAKYLAKEYMEDMRISNKDEIIKVVNGFEKINSYGIKAINFKFYMDCIIRIIFFSIICAIR